MAEIVLKIPNPQLARVVSALCAVGGYSEDPDDQPARREFARQVLGDRLRRVVTKHEQREAVAQARAAVGPVEPVTVD